jgi:SpoIIAA-like
MESPVPDGWQPNGPHWICFEPPNLFLSRMQGEVRREQVERTFQTMQEKIDEIGPIYWIANISGMGKLTTDAKTVKGPPGRVHDPKNVLGVAIVGSTFHLRIVAQLAIKANRLLRGDRSPLNVEFFSNEDEARAWVDHCRAKVAPS